MTIKEIEMLSKIFNCSPNHIKYIKQLKKGMTNNSYIISFDNKKYIVRSPGEGSSKLIDRKKEYEVYKNIMHLNISDEIIYINPFDGYKVAVFYDNAVNCDPYNFEIVRSCISNLKAFHDKNICVPFHFDIFERIEFFESLLKKESKYPDYKKTKENIKKIKKYIDSLKIEYTLCHIDSVCDNFIIIDNSIRIIDWEYSAMQDRHIDIAMFAIYSLYKKSDVDRLIDIYFEGKCCDSIRIKIYCYIAICGFLWSNWCEYKESFGKSFGKYSIAQYNYAKKYFEIIRELGYV